MSATKTISNSSNLIINLKSNIDSRKLLITQHRQFLIMTNADSKHIIINRLDYEDLLDEFEFTIIQSLQAIKSLEIENLNLREIIGEFQSENCTKTNSNHNCKITHEQKEVLNSIENEELSNYKFKSPTNTNFNYQEYLNKFDEVTFSNEFRQKEESEHIVTDDKLEDEKEIIMEFKINPSKDNKTSIKVIEGDYKFETDRDYESPQSREQNSKMQNEEKKIESVEDWKNFTKAEEIRLNFDYSKYKEFQNFLSPISNLNNINLIQDNSQETLKNNQTIPESENLSNADQINLLMNCNNTEHKIRGESGLCQIENTYSISKDISIREGLRHKIRTKSKSGKTTINNSSRNEYIEEETIPIINSKKFSVDNNSDYRENIFILDLINKINNDNRLKEFLVYEYGNGDHNEFFNKLNKMELNVKEINNIINYFIDLQSKPDDYIYPKNDLKRNDSYKFLNPQKRSNSTRSFCGKRNESTDSKNSRRNISSIKEEIRDIYVEPIKLEDFLRSEKRELKIKIREKTNEFNNFNKRARVHIPINKDIKS